MEKENQQPGWVKLTDKSFSFNEELSDGIEEMARNLFSYLSEKDLAALALLRKEKVRNERGQNLQKQNLRDDANGRVHGSRIMIANIWQMTDEELQEISDPRK